MHSICLFNALPLNPDTDRPCWSTLLWYDEWYDFTEATRTISPSFLPPSTSSRPLFLPFPLPSPGRWKRERSLWDKDACARHRTFIKGTFRPLGCSHSHIKFAVTSANILERVHVKWMKVRVGGGSAWAAPGMSPVWKHQRYWSPLHNASTTIIWPSKRSSNHQRY